MKLKRHKGHGSGTLIANLQAPRSKATYLEIFQSLRSLLTDSSQVSLGLPLPLFTLSTRFRTPLRTGASRANKNKSITEVSPQKRERCKHYLVYKSGNKFATGGRLVQFS